MAGSRSGMFALMHKVNILEIILSLMVTIHLKQEKEERRMRFTVANLSFTSSMISSPPSTASRASTPTSETAAHCSGTNFQYPSYPGNPLPEEVLIINPGRS